MRRSFNLRTKEEAKEAAVNLLHSINRERGLDKDRSLVYRFSSVWHGKVADSFKDVRETPVTPFDIPTKYSEEPDEYIAQAIDENTGEKIGGQAFVYSTGHEPPRWYAVALSDEEINPLNFTLPFRNLPVKGISPLARLRVRFSKPVRPLSIDDIKTEEGQAYLCKYMREEDEPVLYWSFEDKEQYSKGNLDKTEFLQPHPDPDIEDYPDEESEMWLDNMCFINNPHPSILSEATGIKIKSANDYLTAFSKVVSSPLDKREKRAVLETFVRDSSDLLLDFALYEFFRTENYGRLQEILSLYKEFGLPANWATSLTRLSEYNSTLRKLEPLSVEEYVVALYIQEEYSSIVGSRSYKEISQETGIPRSIIYKASKRDPHDPLGFIF